MKNIFIIADTYGCLKPYLDSLSSSRKQSDSAKQMWIERRELQKGKEKKHDSLGTS